MSLKPIEPAGRNYLGQILWLFQCSCGKQSVHVNYLVKSGKIKSCGCSRSGNRTPDSPLKSIFRDYQDRAKKKDLEFSLTIEEFKTISKSNCNYCGSEPSLRNRKGEILINGVDRVDNNKGYVLTNCVPCCTICNMAKSDLSSTEFHKWILRLVSFNK